MKNFEQFFNTPTQDGFEALDIVGDVESMKDFFQKSPRLAKRFFKCEDWLEMARFERHASLKNRFLQNAISVVTSFDDCNAIFNEKSSAQFYNQLEKKCERFCVALCDYFETLSRFEYVDENDVYLEKGKKLILKALKICATREDFEILLSFIAPVNESLVDKVRERMEKLHISMCDEDYIEV